MASKHWGEIEEEQSISEKIVPDVTVDIERSMNKFCIAEFDVDYDEDPAAEEHIVLESMDPLMLYAISLHKHTNVLLDIINEKKLTEAPPMPEMPIIVQKHRKNSLNFINKEFTPFSLGNKIEVPEISSTIVRHILSKSVATMFAHIGFETTHQSVLDFLIDVLNDFMNKMCHSLKTAAEDENQGQLCGFPNIAERVLIELGLGGVKGLHDYYQTRVIKYITVLEKRCNELVKEYENLVVNKSSPADVKVVNVKREKVEEEDEVVEIDNPQVHLPIDAEVGYSSLEAGYQLLSSLEAGASSQNMGENEEDTSTITISPGVVSISETELQSTLSPFTKRKRSK